MPVPESRSQSHRSMSLPSGHQGHGHYSPMSSPQVSIYSREGLYVIYIHHEWTYM